MPGVAVLEQGWTGRLRAWLPTGGMLPFDAWNRRHSWILKILWAHAVVLGLASFAVGNSVAAQRVRGWNRRRVCPDRDGLARRPQDEHPDRRGGLADELGGAGAPVQRADRDALLVLRDGRRRHALSGLASTAGRDRLRRAPARLGQRHRSVDGVQPRGGHREPVEVGRDPRWVHPRHECCGARVVAHERDVPGADHPSGSEAGRGAAPCQARELGFRCDHRNGGVVR